MVVSIDIDGAGTQASHQILMMCTHQDRLTGSNIGQQEVDHDVARVLVKSVGRLVEHQDIRVHRHDGSQRHALLLPARKLIGRGIDQIGNLEQLHGVADATLELVCRQPI